MMNEPFGYFRATIDGWEDCAETDEGAKPLYEAPKWMPIESAPKDGTSVLLLYKSAAIEACWECVEYGDWESGGKNLYWWSSVLNHMDDGEEPTHWMPLPPAPQGE